jgi:hypothetical protein
MKKLLAYTPEPFENLEIMDAEYDVLTGEGEMEEEVVRSRGTRGIRRTGGRRAGQVPMLSKNVPRAEGDACDGIGGAGH